MNRILTAIIFFAISQLAIASPFSDWAKESSKQYKKILIDEAAKAKNENSEKIITRVQEAKSEKKWSRAVDELEILVGKNPDNISNWLNLALYAYQGSTGNHQRAYDLVEKAKNSAVYVYFNSSDKIMRAKALLIIASVFSYDFDTSERCLKEASTFAELPKLREEFPEYADIMPFVFNNHKVDTDRNNPQVCFNFSSTLPPEFKAADYFDITPKFEGTFSVRNSKICLSGIQYGESYNVTIKEGIPDIFGHKTKAPSHLSFLVDDKSPRLGFPLKTYILQKGGNQQVPLTAINVKKVELHVIRVNDRTFVEGFARPHTSLSEEIYSFDLKNIINRYGELIYKGILEIGSNHNKSVTKQIPLNEVIKDLKPGAYGLFAKDMSGSNSRDTSASQWIIITDLGLTVFKGSGGLDVNVRSLSTAKSLNGVEVQLVSYNNQILALQKTGSDGLVKFESALLQGKGGNRPAFVYAYGKDANFSALKLSEPAFDLSDRGVEGRKIPGPLDAFVYTERGVYRPGEEVVVNTLLRNNQAKAIKDIPLTFRLVRPDEFVVQTEMTKGSEQGFYSLKFKMPPSSRTGQWSVQVFADPKAASIGQVKFSIEDFVPTRLQVLLKSESKIFIPGQSLPVEITGRYLFGSAGQGLKGEASVTLRPHPNPFPLYSDYQFGLLDDKFVSQRSELQLPVLDKEGKALLDVQVDAIPETSVFLQAIVQASLFNKGGRPQRDSLKLDVQNFPFMIGIKGKFPNGVLNFHDKTADIEIITLNCRGDRVAVQNLQYSLYEEEYSYSWLQNPQNYTWQYEPVQEDKQVVQKTIFTTVDQGALLSLPIEGWGSYRLEVKDMESKAISSFRFTKGHLSSPNSINTPDKLTVVQDKSSYAAGDVVKLHVKSPIDGEALLVIANHEVIEARNITVSEAGTDITVKTAQEWGTGAYALVTAFRPLDNKGETNLQALLLPKRAVGLAWIALSPEPQILNIALTVPKEIKPRQTLDLPVHVEGNRQSQTFMTVAAVDEGILMLTDFQTPMPQNYFLGKRTLGVEMRDLYGKIMDAIPGETGILRSGGDTNVLARNLAALSKRSFQIVSLFKGPVALDKNGKASVPLDIPDFNGTLRLMAVAFNEAGIGSAQASLLVRDPVVSEPVLPRFLSAGDTSQMALSLFNPSEETKSITVTVKSEGSTSVVAQPISMTLEKKGSWHTSFPLKGESIGDGKITITLSGSGFEPIVRSFDITVRPASLPVVQTTALLIKPGEKQSVDLSRLKDYLPGMTSLMLTASGYIPWDMTGVLKSLLDYPYGCIEQTVSRGFGVLYKGRMGILNKGETQEDFNTLTSKAVFQILATLAEKQNNEGYFSLWNTYEAGDAWLTAYVIDFMNNTKVSGLKIPENMYNVSAQWLQRFIRNCSSDSSQTEMASAAYGLSVLAGEDQIDDGIIRYFFDTIFDKLVYPLSRAQVGFALAKIGDMARATRAFKNLVPEKEGDPSLMPYGTANRNRAAMATTLLKTINLAPTLSWLAPVADTHIRILAQEMKSAYRLSTQENSWLLQAGLALTTDQKRQDKTIKGKTAGDAQLLMNDKILTEDSSHPVSVKVDNDLLAKGITLSNKGQTPLWVHYLLDGSLKNPPKAEEKNLKIKRTIYTLNGENLVLDAKTPLLQGDQFIVVLSGELTGNITPGITHYLLVADWLPAGFEIESGQLSPEIIADQLREKKSGLGDDLKAILSSPMMTQARDDRFVAALKLVDDIKSFTVAYRVRAVTPGFYNYPGLQVEDMFMPDIRASTSAGMITIKAR